MSEKQQEVHLKYIRRFSAAMEEFRKLNPEIQAQTVLTFLLVAEQGEIPMSEIQVALNIGRSSGSRNVAYLSDIEYKPSKHGYGLLSTYENPFNRKQKIVRLTQKGEWFARAIASLIQGSDE